MLFWESKHAVAAILTLTLVSRCRVFDHPVAADPKARRQSHEVASVSLAAGSGLRGGGGFNAAGGRPASHVPRSSQSFSVSPASAITGLLAELRRRGGGGGAATGTGFSGGGGSSSGGGAGGGGGGGTGSGFFSGFSATHQRHLSAAAALSSPMGSPASPVATPAVGWSATS